MALNEAEKISSPILPAIPEGHQTDTATHKKHLAPTETVLPRHTLSILSKADQTAPRPIPPPVPTI